MSLKDSFAAMKPGGASPAPRGPIPVHAQKQEQKAGSAPGHLVGMNAKFQELSDEVATLRKGKGGSIRVRLDLCDDGDHHPYPIDADRVADLIPSMKSAGQTNPALVMPKEGGRYLIVSGRHRKQALLEMGETEWDVVVKDVPTSKLRQTAFFDNLLAPQLSDYERYQGIKKLRDEEGLSLEQIAQESGIGKSTVYRHMRFGDLPQEAQALIERRHKVFTSLMADQLASLAKTNPSRVTEAFQKVFDEQMNHTQAVAWALMPEIPSTRDKPPTIEFKSGKKLFAKMTVRGQTIAVQVSKGVDPSVLEDAIQAVIAQKAKELGKS